MPTHSDECTPRNTSTPATTTGSHGQHTLSRFRACSFSRPFSLSFSFALSHIHTLSVSQKHSLSCFSLFLSLSLFLSMCLALTHTHTHTHTHTQDRPDSMAMYKVRLENVSSHICDAIVYSVMMLYYMLCCMSVDVMHYVISYVILYVSNIVLCHYVILYCKLYVENIYVSFRKRSKKFRVLSENVL